MAKVTNPRQLAVLTLNKLERRTSCLKSSILIEENSLSSLEGLYTSFYGTVPYAAA